MVAMVAAGVTAAVVPSATHLTDFVIGERAAHRVSVAQKLRDPDGLVLLERGHGACLGETAIRCATSKDPHVDALAAQARAALTRISGEQATLRCSTGFPHGRVPMRFCDVQVYGGLITVSVSTRTRRAGGTDVPAGSDYRVDAS
jgi:hypothetical protein